MIIQIKRFNSLNDVFIDDDNLHLISGKKLYVSNHGYVRIYNGKIGKTTQYILLHKLVMNNTKDLIDHINGNKLDNRICNLRLANKAINAHNSKRNRELPKNISFCKFRKNYVFGLKVGSVRYRKRFMHLHDAIEYKNFLYASTGLNSIVHKNNI